MSLFSQLPKVGILRQSIVWQSRRCFQTSQIMSKQMLTKTLRIKHEDYYRRLDGIPENYKMIYKLPLHYTLNLGKDIAVATPSAATIALLYYKYFNFNGLAEEPASYFISFHAADQTELNIFVASLFILNFIVYRICHISTLRIYNNEESYIAIVSGLIPRFNNKFHFKKGQATEHFRALSMFRGLTYKVAGRTMLLVPDRFRKASDLFNMLHDKDSKKYKIAT